MNIERTIRAAADEEEMSNNQGSYHWFFVVVADQMRKTYRSVVADGPLDGLEDTFKIEYVFRGCLHFVAPPLLSIRTNKSKHGDFTVLTFDSFPCFSKSNRAIPPCLHCLVSLVSLHQTGEFHPVNIA